MLLHIPLFSLDTNSYQTTQWTKLTPQTRLFCALVMVFSIVLTSETQGRNFLLYGGFILGLITISQITLKTLLKRITIESLFIATILLGTLFTEGKTICFQWYGLTITKEGILLLFMTFSKALLCLCILNILTMTTSVNDLLKGLTALKVPPIIISIIAGMMRYLEVLIEEFKTMKRAGESRNLWHSQGHQKRLIIGNMFGSLFIRTFDRGERIYYAMLSRGYNGLIAQEDLQFIKPYDRIVIVSVIVAVLIVQLYSYL